LLFSKYRTAAGVASTSQLRARAWIALLDGFPSANDLEEAG
jgi:hypothetical protein